jgi:hypothetical protein
MREPISNSMDKGICYELMEKEKWNANMSPQKTATKKGNKDSVLETLLTLAKEDLGESNGVFNIFKNPVEHVNVDNFDQEKWQVKYSRFEPVIAMLIEAFNNHKPIAFTPDLIYGYIGKGFANHIKKHAEALRGLFVSHDGKKELIYQNDNFVLGSQDNKWGLFFEEIAKQLKEDTNSVLVQNDLLFSTSTPVTVAHRHVLAMETMEKYDDYNCNTKCGIAAVSLLGENEDWEKLHKVVREQFKVLNDYCDKNDKLDASLKWWEPELLKALEMLAMATSGNLSSKKKKEIKDWLSKVLKYHDVNGSGTVPKVSGWINVLFPYLKEAQPNPWFQRKGCKIAPVKYPSCHASVPFKWNYIGDKKDMRALIGHVILSELTQEDSLLPLGTIMPFPAWIILHMEGSAKNKMPRNKGPTDNDPSCAIL